MKTKQILITLFFILLLSILAYFIYKNNTDKTIPIIITPTQNNSITKGELAENPEGEADPTRMKLNMKTWIWQRTSYTDGKIIKPILEKRFTLTFKDNKTFSASTDCNGVGGEFTVNNDKISFEKMMSTLMYCEDSQESIFSKMLQESDNYHFTSKGELILGLKSDKGSVIFR